MAKKKKPLNRLALENDLSGLNKLLQDQNFENIEDVQSFLNTMVGKKLDEVLPKKSGRRSKKEQAQEMVIDAYDMNQRKGRQQMKKALTLDPDNADAWIYLAETSDTSETALEYYKKALIAGKNAIGETTFEEFRGHFWGLHETRPFMRAKEGLAICLGILERPEEAIKHYQEMLKLNPSDNQGVRYRLAILLIENNKFSAYDKLYKAYPDEGGASWQYSYTLNLFIGEGNTPKSAKALKAAYKCNPHVLKFFSGEKEFPEELPEYVGFGDENEAIHYVRSAVGMWVEVPGALDWVRGYYLRWKNMN